MLTQCVPSTVQTARSAVEYFSFLKFTYLSFACVLQHKVRHFMDVNHRYIMYIGDVNLEDVETGSFSFFAPTQFLADRTWSRLCYTRYSVASVCRLSVTLCTVPKRCVLEQKLLLIAWRKSYGN